MGINQFQTVSATSKQTPPIIGFEHSPSHGARLFKHPGCQRTTITLTTHSVVVNLELRVKPKPNSRASRVASDLRPILGRGIVISVNLCWPRWLTTSKKLAMSSFQTTIKFNRNPYLIRHF